MQYTSLCKLCNMHHYLNCDFINCKKIYCIIYMMNFLYLILNFMQIMVNRNCYRSQWDKKNTNIYKCICVCI